MERMPNFDSKRIIGASEKEESETLLAIESIQGKDLEKGDYDIEHFEEFNEIFEYINKNLEVFLSRYGLSKSNILSKDIVILTKDHPQGKKANGGFNSALQKIELFRSWDEAHRLKFVRTLVHEMIHAQVFQSWDKIDERKLDGDFSLVYNSEEEKIKTHLRLRRQGFSIKSKNGEDIYFTNIDEALTEELAIRFFQEFGSSIPHLSEEYQLTQETAEREFENWNMTLEQAKKELASVDYIEKDGISKRTLIESAYGKERDLLNSLIDEIYAKNSKDFNDREEVFMIFAKGSITGRLLPIARLVDGTFGRGSFKNLAENSVGFSASN